MMQHILVGLDGSPLAETILPYVSFLARRLGADVTLIHVVHLPEELRQGKHSPAVEQALPEIRSQAQAYLHSVEQHLTEGGIAVRSVVEVGDTASEIRQYARSVQE
ncbi:MAG: universal stress protein [Chloroflexi bacterium]|nr:universal stress protein [Chloroflexota bacterium]